MDIKNEEHHHAGEFYAEEEGEKLGIMKYLVKEGVMNIYHTEVSPKLQGKNIGFKLVEAGVKYAREKELKILPTCTFAKSVFDRMAAFADVLA